MLSTRWGMNRYDSANRGAGRKGIAACTFAHAAMV